MTKAFRNHSRHKTFVTTVDGLVEVPPGEEVEVEGERRIDLARQNARLEEVGAKKGKSDAAKAAEKKASRKGKRRRAPRKPPAKGKSRSRKAAEKKTEGGTVTSDKVPKP